MTGLEPIAVAALTKAVDFLFDEAGKLMDERRTARKARGDAEDTPASPAGTTATTKEDILLNDMGQRARRAARTLALASTEQKNAALQALAAALADPAPRCWRPTRPTWSAAAPPASPTRCSTACC